jgi:hypothetical protein
MKRVALVCLSLIMLLSVGTALSLAQSPMGGSAPTGPVQAPPVSKVHQQANYGYVPPPPILHTWPGGYRVIIHEMTNSLIDHILGKY